MVTAQILKDRPFNLADGSRKLIICNISNTDRVFTRSYREKPIFSNNPLEAKTYQDQRALDNAIQNIFIKNKYDYKLYRVDELFEPKYIVKLKEKSIFSDPSIECYNTWVPKNETKKHSYSDYDLARKHLDEAKAELVEYYYQKIMELRRVEIIQIKTGAEDRNP